MKKPLPSQSSPAAATAAALSRTGVRETPTRPVALSRSQIHSGGTGVRRMLKGSDDGDRQMVKILSAVLADGLAAVEAACAEALAGGVHSADVVLNILARRRDPGPVATILTPDALQLRHAPIADCARYDGLRRAS